MSQVCYSFDWIRGTLPFNGLYAETTEPLQKWFGDVEWQNVENSHRPYIEGVECKYCSIQWHPEHHEFGCMFQMTGAQCANALEQGFFPAEIIARGLAVGMRYTRIDWAVDLTDAGGRPIDLYNSWLKGTLHTPARKVTIIQQRETGGQVTGETVYVGTRQSERLLRVYDKGAERELKIDWIRAEIELKGDRAKQFARTMADKGAISTGLSSIRASVLSSGVEWFENIFDGKYEVFPVSSLGRAETNFEKWFWKIVLPAVGKALRMKIPGAQGAIRSLLDTDSKHGP